jgi:HEAT repeat protein
MFFICVGITAGAHGGNQTKADTLSAGEAADDNQPMVTDIELMEQYEADLKAAIPALVEGLKSSDASIRRNAAFALGELGSDGEPALQALGQVLTADPDFEVRRNAAFALGEIGGPAIPVLLTMLNDKDPRVRRNVTAALVRIGQPAVPHLIRLLKDTDSTMRRNAAVILGGIGPQARDAIPALEQALQDHDKGFCWTVKQALRKIKQLPSEDSADPLRDKDTPVRVNALKEPGDTGEKAQASIPSLIASLNDEKAEVRKHAAFALANIGAPAVPALIEALQSNDVNMRKNAVFSLGEIGRDAEPAVPALTAMKHDPSSNVRWVVDSALKKITGK